MSIVRSGPHWWSIQAYNDARAAYSFRPTADFWDKRLGNFKPFDTHCCHMGTAIKHPVPDRVKPSFIIFDIRTLWRSGLLNDGLTRSAWNGMLYSYQDWTWVHLAGSNPTQSTNSLIQSNPIHDVCPCSDPHPIQSIEPPAPKIISLVGPIQKSVQHFELMHAVRE